LADGDLIWVVELVSRFYFWVLRGLEVTLDIGLKMRFLGLGIVKNVGLWG